MSALVGGLGVNGKLIVVGVDFAPIEVTPVQLIMGGGSIQGWNTGTSADAEDTLRFSELSGVRPMVETSAAMSWRGLREDDERAGAIPRCPHYEVT